MSRKEPTGIAPRSLWLGGTFWTKFLPLVVAMLGMADAAWGLDVRTLDHTRDAAADCVVRVSAGTRHGSGVLLEVANLSGKSYGYFATCYHVLYNAKEFVVEDFYGNSIGNGRDANFFLDPARDTVIFRVELPAAGKAVLKPIFEPGQYRAAIAADQQADSEVVAIGYPYFDKYGLYGAQVRLGQSKDAATFGFKDRVSVDFPVRIISADSTARGMSGGPVLDPGRRIAGIVVARLPDTVGFIIPSEILVEDVKLAVVAGASLKGWSALDFSKWEKMPYESGFVKCLQDASDGIENWVEWDLAAQWQVLFQQSLNFRERFQEVKVDLPSLLPKSGKGKEALKPDAPVRLHIDPETFADGQPGRVKVWVAGVANVRDQTVFQDEASRWVDLPAEALQPGENLVVVSRHSGREGGAARGQRSPGERAAAGDERFELNRFFKPVPLQFSVWVGDQRVYTVHRELPGLFESYSIFLTIVQTPPSKVSRGYNAYLAVRLNQLAEVLNKNPVNYKGVLHDDRKERVRGRRSRAGDAASGGRSDEPDSSDGQTGRQREPAVRAVAPTQH